MKPFVERTPDLQYRQLLERIMNEGRDMMPIHGIGARSIVGHQIRYNLENGFPLITERDLAKTLPGALGAHIGLLEGDLGDGSYGAAWGSFPTKEGEPFNQIAHVVQQIQERPHLRTHIVS